MEVFRYPRALARSSGLGVVMGLLPGIGEFGAQFLSYSLARRFSKKPEEFGKGSPEGLAASESSISACTSTGGMWSARFAKEPDGVTKQWIEEGHFTVRVAGRDFP